MNELRAEIISVGTELLLGFTVNTNAVSLSRALAGIGVNLYRQSVVGDNRERIAQALKASLKRADIIALTGGLGPTLDDITVEAVAKALKRKKMFDARIWKGIQKRYRMRGWFPHPATRQQAWIIRGAHIIPNRFGSAPGQIVRVGKKYVILVPGVPAEATEMMAYAARYLKKRLKSPFVIQSTEHLVTGLTEPQVQEHVKDLLQLKGAVTCGIYAGPQHVTLRLTAKGRSTRSAVRMLAPYKRLIQKRLGSFLYSSSGRPLEEVVGRLLRAQRLTLAVSESCTGGLLANRLTDIPGSSAYFKSGIIAYADQAKEGLGGVPKKLIQRHGAVSAEVAEALARGIRKRAQTDLGLAVTGIAGPGGGSKKKPVGLVYIALANRKTILLERHHFQGRRDLIKLKSSQAALDLVRRTLQK